MNDDERLREALLELGHLRAKEAERLRETTTLLSALEVLTTADNIEEGIRTVQSLVRDALDCEAVAVFTRRDGRLSDGKTTWDAPGLLTRARRIVDMHKVAGLWANVPGAYARMRSMISVPIGEADDRAVLAAFAVAPGKFSGADAELLARMATVASEAILRRSLESRNAFLAAVIDRSPVSVAIAKVTEDLPLVYINDAFTALTGYGPDEILGQNCRLLSAEPPDSPVRAAIRTTVTERTSGTFTVRNLRKSGEIFWNELQLFPVVGADGQTSHIVATQTDATQRRQAEIDRDAAIRRLEGALTATSEACLVLGQSGKVRFANTSFEAMLAPMPIVRDDVLPPEARRLLLGHGLRVGGDTDTEDFAQSRNFELTLPNGRQFMVRSRAIPDGGAVVAASDITQVKVNERALRQRLAAIERSQDGVAIGDKEGRLIDVNPSLLSLWGGLAEEDVLGSKWTRYYDKTSIEAFLTAEGWFQRTGVWRGEVDITRDGNMSVHDVSISLVPEVGSVLIVRDITERRRNVEERAQLRRRLDRAQMQERLHQVSAGLAHDFNNLLSAILGSAAFIESSGALTDPARDAVKRIQLAASRAAELTDSYLDLGDRERAAERIELGEILRNTVDLVRGSAPRGVRLSASLQNTPLMIEASQTDLLQVIMNLVVNAIDAHDGKPGEVLVSVRTGTPNPAAAQFLFGTPKAASDYVGILVEDAGKGMAKETIDHVLEPYFTTKGNAGTGLGLAIVGSIMNDNGALLEIESEVGRGSKFTVWWPLGSVDAEVANRQVIPAATRKNLPILVLDDVREVATAIAADLSFAGFEVAEINEPELALEAIEEDPDAWGCLVTDYDMPGLTGGDMIERLRIIAPGLPVIVVSALARRLTDNRLTTASAVLQKPVNRDKLLAAMRAALTAPVSKGR